MKLGDTFTLGGVRVADKRPRWLRIWYWLIRKPAPVRPLQTFRVVESTASHARYEERK